MVAGRLDERTGGSIYNRRMAEGLRRLGWSVDIRELSGDFPQPDRSALERAARVFSELPTSASVMVDGLAFSALPDLAERESTRLRLVALVHQPIAAETGLDRKTEAAFEVAERRALHAATLVIVTGTATFPLLARYDLAHERVALVEPGTDPAPFARTSGGVARHLLCVANVNPSKGHDVLLRALAEVPHRDWHLACAGSLTRDPETAVHVQQLAAELGLADRVTFLGDLDHDELERCYASADLFVLATRLETYGMAVAEAVAHGLPVISTTTGAIPALVGDEAGVLCEPGDIDGLTTALTRAIGDAGLRSRLAEGARRASDRLPTWDAAASNMAEVLKGVEPRG